jgi:hypothetical protein
LSQSNPLDIWQDFNKTYTIIHQMQKKIDISSVFRMKNLQIAGIDNVFVWINPVEKINVHDLFRSATSTEEK